ncbi:hypothetical protein F441_21552 [Phytophthora nicotianae CJ01A1]|uniref:Uncharacterized protein n=4 Tax=Phytophthora nicotianae TaxID=4792 RepID=V9DX01_PHYNI|nr:hypothetical protein F443_21660 [Phytophthora nicotianae P1569]ETK71738.1 hypothetical protein L915_21065 [Phytophthora nicotianae]ETO60063.1 hypothetical protein F444_21701 [Phytophthora nicotianae P1976]ETP01157.1 hypothetical protein F441_21552 [Phytophthora nicotianae CJ01A1]ETL25173.1 hypothetical protein L916_20942 [Phytophthora nicotianae]
MGGYQALRESFAKPPSIQTTPARRHKALDILRDI